MPTVSFYLPSFSIVTRLQAAQLFYYSWQGSRAFLFAIISGMALSSGFFFLKKRRRFQNA
jgi:LPXTG-motif cell wall-anchored protein